MHVRSILPKRVRTKASENYINYQFQKCRSEIVPVPRLTTELVIQFGTKSPPAAVSTMYKVKKYHICINSMPPKSFLNINVQERLKPNVRCKDV